MKKILSWILIIGLIFGVGFGSGIFVKGNKGNKAEVQQKDKYVAFIDEVFATIQENYWNKLNDE
mgnify:CR=1 FL=1